MREQRIDILSDDVLLNANAVCFTSNGVVGAKGLVMGAGVAKAFRDRFPELPEYAGRLAKANGNVCQVVQDKIVWADKLHSDISGLLNIIAFPTKHHWKDPSDLKLIVKSAKELMAIVEARKWSLVYLTRPGVGCGGLDWEKQVKPAIEHILDDRVVVCWL